ncbi:hypothetical protein FACS1894189_5480 [Planctomycetales bacterium]|nr:hypothetical protein FACS1894189_5480 [Planctomycetales bacterium]
MKNCITTILCTVVLSITAVSAEKDLLRTESGLHEKLIVTDNNAVFRTKPEMQAKAENASAFSIFWRLTTGTPDNTKDGYYRIGGPDGTEIGWIEKKFVTPWRTRFCLDPMLPQPDRFFSVKNSEAELKFVGQSGQIPSGHKRFALITKSEDNENEEAALDVVVFTGNIESGGGVGGEKMALANMELDVVFLIDTTPSMEPMIEMVKQITSATAKSLADNKEIRDIVHFGIVEYRDKEEGCDFDAKVTCDLKQNYDTFKSTLSHTVCDTCDTNKVPEEVSIGLQMAINDAGWRSNSSKHIILLGDAPSKEPGLKIFGETYASSRSVNLDKVINLARPQSGGDGQRAWMAKNIHAIMNDHKPIIDQFCDELKEIGIEQKTIDGLRESMTDPKTVRIVVDDTSGYIRALQQGGLSKELATDLALTIYRNALFEECTQITKTQFSKLAQNLGAFQGFFQAVNTYTNDGSKDRAIDGLIKALEESFKALEKARTGKTEDDKTITGSAGAISQGIYQIISTNAPPDRFKDLTTFAGVAKGRDENGRLVAEKKIMVMKDELRSFRSTMDSLYTQFKSKSNKADRQDVSQILKTMTESIVSVAAGEKQIDEGMKLDKILAFEFPLKTPALSVSARDIAVMTTPAFNSWLEQLSAASDRASQLLEKPDNWTTLNNHLKQEFTFLKLSELP